MAAGDPAWFAKLRPDDRTVAQVLFAQPNGEAVLRRIAAAMMNTSKPAHAPSIDRRPARLRLAALILQEPDVDRDKLRARVAEEMAASAPWARAAGYKMASAGGALLNLPAREKPRGDKSKDPAKLQAMPLPISNHDLVEAANALGPEGRRLLDDYAAAGRQKHEAKLRAAFADGTMEAARAEDARGKAALTPADREALYDRGYPMEATPMPATHAEHAALRSGIADMARYGAEMIRAQDANREVIREAARRSDIARKLTAEYEAEMAALGDFSKPYAN